VSALNTSAPVSATKAAFSSLGVKTEAEFLNWLCYLASLLLNLLTYSIRTMSAVLQLQVDVVVQILQSFDVLTMLGELALLFSSYLVHQLSSVHIGKPRC
jgi:hypothetical protein